MRVLFDINHPVQVHLLRHVIRHMKDNGHAWSVLARDKDVALHLLQHYEIPYAAPVDPGKGRLGHFRELVGREWAMLRLARRFHPDLIVGTSVHAARVARLCGARSAVINDDDATAVPLFALLAYPLATVIITPACLRHEKHGRRHLMYPANQQLFYLHPCRFKPDPDVRGALGLKAGEPFAIIRLSALSAHHDRGMRGLDDELLQELERRLSCHMRLLISSERPLPQRLSHLKLPVPPERLHDALAFADLYVGDSQSMTAEAAVLGVPALRINDFIGRISYLTELERHELAFGFKPTQGRELIEALVSLAVKPDRRRIFAERRRRLLAEMIDPLPWLLEVLERLGEGRGRKKQRRLDAGPKAKDMTPRAHKPADAVYFAKVYDQAWQDVAHSPPKWSFEHLVRRCQELLFEIDVADKSVLDVGAGDGFLSHYLSFIVGARAVLSVDEYEGHGAETDLHGVNLSLQKALADSNKVRVIKCDILKLQSDTKIDLIVFVNSLHHIICCRGRLGKNPDAFARAVTLFNRLRELLSEDGEILIQDVFRHNLCPLPQYRKRFREIDWKSKQNAAEWTKALRHAGFNKVSVRYRLPLILPDKAGLRRVFNNRPASLLTDSSYVLRAR